MSKSHSLAPADIAHTQIAMRESFDGLIDYLRYVERTVSDLSQRVAQLEQARIGDGVTWSGIGAAVEKLNEQRADEVKA